MRACLTLQAPPGLAGSPLFTWNPLVTCRRYVPRKQSHILATNEYDISVFPIERQGRLLHNTFNFGANCPLHLSIPAYHLPAYASRCLLPHTAQDSVLDCWLGFVKVVIADHSLPCASRRNPHRSGRELLDSSGSYCPAVGRIPICQWANRLGSLFAMRLLQ